MRERVLKFFNASPSDYSVVFTSGATGALHTVGEVFPWSKNSKFYYLAEVAISSAIYVLEPQFRLRYSRIRVPLRQRLQSAERRRHAT